MAVLVDTNVIADVIFRDPRWMSWSATQISQRAEELVINPMIYSELCFHARSGNEVDQLVTSFGFGFLELPKSALFLAAQAFRQYRRQGGTKIAPLPDFFIGAHAATAGIPLLTRDRGRYLTYFPEVTLICP